MENCVKETQPFLFISAPFPGSWSKMTHTVKYLGSICRSQGLLVLTHMWAIWSRLHQTDTFQGNGTKRNKEELEIAKRTVLILKVYCFQHWETCQKDRIHKIWWEEMKTNQLVTPLIKWNGKLVLSLFPSSNWRETCWRGIEITKRVGVELSWQHSRPGCAKSGVWFPALIKQMWHQPREKGHPQVYIEFRASLGYLTAFWKTKVKKLVARRNRDKCLPSCRQV